MTSCFILSPHICSNNMKYLLRPNLTVNYEYGLLSAQLDHLRSLSFILFSFQIHMSVDRVIKVSFQSKNTFGFNIILKIAHSSGTFLKY